MTLVYRDVRGMLPYNASSPWIRRRALSDLSYAAVHYSADKLPASATLAQELQRLIDDANYHLAKDWSSDGSGVHGFALMYAYSIFMSGRIYVCNDEELITWSVTNGNPVTLSTVLILGPGQKPSAPMLATLGAHLDRLTSRPDLPGITRQNVFGHGEMGRIYGGGPDFGNNTPCPDQALAFVKQYRKAVLPMPPQGSMFFSVTGQYVSHGFLDYFLAGGGIGRFGYPLTGEIEEEQEDGNIYTVQYFERSRFEWHRELNPAQVLEGRLGAEVLGLRHTSGIGIPAPGNDH
jgi:hypothetical protein